MIDSLKCVLTLPKFRLHCTPKVDAFMKIPVTLKWCTGSEPENEELLELLMSAYKIKNVFIEQNCSCSFNLFPLTCILSQQQFVASDVVGGQSPESYKVTYKPYQNGIHQKMPVLQEGTRRNEVFEDLQHEFLGNDDSKCLLFRLEINLCESSLEVSNRKSVYLSRFLVGGQLKVC